MRYYYCCSIVTRIFLCKKINVCNVRDITIAVITRFFLYNFFFFFFFLGGGGGNVRGYSYVNMMTSNLLTTLQNI